MLVHEINLVQKANEYFLSSKSFDNLGYRNYEVPIICSVGLLLTFGLLEFSLRRLLKQQRSIFAAFTKLSNDSKISRTEDAKNNFKNQRMFNEQAAATYNEQLTQDSVKIDLIRSFRIQFLSFVTVFILFLFLAVGYLSHTQRTYSQNILKLNYRAMSVQKYGIKTAILTNEVLKQDQVTWPDLAALKESTLASVNRVASEHSALISEKEKIMPINTAAFDSFSSTAQQLVATVQSVLNNPLAATLQDQANINKAFKDELWENAIKELEDQANNALQTNVSVDTYIAVIFIIIVLVGQLFIIAPLSRRLFVISFNLVFRQVQL